MPATVVANRLAVGSESILGTIPAWESRSRRNLPASAGNPPAERLIPDSQSRSGVIRDPGLTGSRFDGTAG